MNDFEKIEHLLLSKKFEELNPTELKEVQGYFENATDYNDIRDTLMQVKSTLATDKLLIKPSVELKEKLLQQFENTYSNAGNKTGKTRPFYRKMAFQWSAAASIVVLLTLSAVTYFNNLNGVAKSKEMAVNTEKKSDDGTPPSEKTNLNNDLTVVPTDSTSTGVSTGEGKTGYISNAPIGSTTMDAEEDKSATFGNISATEESVKEGEVNNQSTITNPNDEVNKPVMKNNSTLDDSKDRSETQDYRDDANDQYNNAVKGKEESKMLENSTNVPMKTVNEKNTNTDTKNYWQSKKQNPNRTKDSDKDKLKQEPTEDINVGDTNGYMSVNQMVQTDKRDSLKTSLDSLQMDSNQFRSRQRDAKLDSQKDEKNN